MHTVQAGPWYKTYVIGDGNEGEKANQYQQSHWQIPFPGYDPAPCYIYCGICTGQPLADRSGAAICNGGRGCEHGTAGDYFGILGLNAPPTERYLNWLSAILRGDMGVSLLYRQPVACIISERFINTFALMMTSWILSGIIGFVLGCVMGICQGKWVDSIIKRICLVLCSVPTFWLGLVFLLIFSVWLGWFPIGFSSPIGIADTDVSIWQRLYHLVLPALTLSFISFANVALHTRQKLIDVLESDYVLFARARGNDTWTIMKRHGFRNILLPAITYSLPPLQSSLVAASLLKMYFHIRDLARQSLPPG